MEDRLVAARDGKEEGIVKRRNVKILLVLELFRVLLVIGIHEPTQVVKLYRTKYICPHTYKYT